MSSSTSLSTFVPAQPPPSSPLKSSRFEGQTVAVTGGAGGIGASCVRRFHAEGANVLIVDLADAAGEALVDELNTLRANSTVYQRCDVSNEEEVIAAFQTPEAKALGPIDALVTMAAIFLYGEVHKATSADWDKVLAVNLKGTAFACKAVIPQMRERRKGSIVLVSSITGTISFPAFVPYSATKAAIIQMSRDIALDNGRYGIRVNAMVPGAIFTEAGTGAHARNEGRPLEDLVSELSSDVMLRRMGLPEECASVAAFLASSDANYVTGASLHVDGGFARKLLP